ncbi:hypothetical protein [Paenibacillus rhizoplanae]|uniref:Uncharacterized protein n=1 Tax=Paenibacillus rhizoplanae TaxID=1917181 RepID=A0ABW5FIB3_9BACL
MIRYLPLNPRCYETLIHFFHSSGWSLSSLRQKWLQVVRQHAPLSVVKQATSGLFFRYLRTPSHAVVSEASAATYLRKSTFHLSAQNSHIHSYISAD